MTDIWEEKPIRPSSETVLMFERRRYSWEYQLKIEYDKLKEKADLFDKMPQMIRNTELKKKLEALRKYFKFEIEQARRQQPSLRSTLEEGLKILEEQNTGVSASEGEGAPEGVSV